MESIEMDPMKAGAIALFHFFRHEKPFSDADWRAPGSEVAPQYKDLIRTSVIGYQLFTYLQLIEQKFGSEIARIIREHQIIAISRWSNQMADEISEIIQTIQRAHESAMKNRMKIPDHPDIEVPIEYLMALHLLIVELKDSPCYLSIDRRTTETVPEIPDDLDRVLARCLAHGRDAAIEVFGPMVRIMELRPETVSGLRHNSSESTSNIVNTRLIWSEDPGCFERHLQRKHENILFPSASRIVTQDEIDAARAHDLSEAEALWAKIMNHCESVPPGDMTVTDLNEQRSRVDDLMQEAAEIGNSRAESATANLYWSIIGDMEKSLSNDLKSAEILQNANEFYVKVGLAMKNRFVAQLCRQDSPIKPEEVLPALLTEDPETIRKFMIFVEDDEDLRNLHKHLPTDAIDLVKKVQATGAILPKIEEKLRALGIQLQP